MNPTLRSGVCFGPFCLVVAERLLLRDGNAVALGARALDLLITLVNAAPNLVSKTELMAQVWPNVTVDEGSLRFHIYALRKALGDGEDGARFVETVAGRGYVFVAPFARAQDDEVSTVGRAIEYPNPRLPPRPLRMIGRDSSVEAIAAQILEDRFVTVVGPGGVGKTTVAIAVGHRLLEVFGGSVVFIDLSELNDPSLVQSALASILGLSVQSIDPTPGIISFLRLERMLIILDNCEHVIGAASALAELIYKSAPQTHILTTSREYLWVEGEHVHRLMPLECPPDDVGLTAATVLRYPAAQLFVERAAANANRFVLTDTDAGLAASICRKLDGVALALELAASRVEAYGLQQINALLDERLTLVWQGRRTAPARQQTLQATLDWSFDLLIASERIVLSRLSVFVGSFSLNAARAVAAFGEVDDASVLSAVSSLVAKSLVTADTRSTVGRYRLMETTRAHAIQKLAGRGETGEISRRHAAYYIDSLKDTVGNRASNREHLGNIRAALDWSLGPHGDVAIAVPLAAAATPVFLELSLLTECCRWTDLAIGLLDDTTRGDACEMELQAGLGLSLMFTQGNGNAARIALERGLHLAELLEDRLNQLRLLGRLHIFEERLADFGAAFIYAERSEAVAKDIDDPAGIGAAHSLLGISHHLIGNHDRARAELEAALRQAPKSERINTIYFGFDHQNRARIALSRTLWLQGYPDQAIAVARQTVAEAAVMDHPVTLCIALIWGVSVLLWSGDNASATEYIDRFAANAEIHSLAPYKAVAVCVSGQLAILAGDSQEGVRALQDGLERLHAGRYELLTTEFNCSLAQGLSAIGRLDDALALIEETIGLVERNGDLFYLPELLRLKALIVMTRPFSQQDTAEAFLKRSIVLSQRQAARGWTLRAAVDMAGLCVSQGRAREAQDVLGPVFDSFTEGFDTADLQAAATLLSRLNSAVS